VTRSLQPDAAGNGAGDVPASPPPEMLRRLTDSLDCQIDLLGRREAELDALSESIIANDNDRMERVLDEMAQSRQHQAQADARFQAARDELAGRLGWPAGNTRLERLLGIVGQNDRRLLARRRRQVTDLAERIRRKHRQTAVLLAECARINRLLIECIVGPGQRVTLYGQHGQQHWRGCGSLMDAER
jgi:hypothetical protein